MFSTSTPKKPSRGDWETEYQAAAAFDRPPRNDLTRPPHYPWMPHSYRVSFKLGFN